MHYLFARHRGRTATLFAASLLAMLLSLPLVFQSTIQGAETQQSSPADPAITQIKKSVVLITGTYQENGRPMNTFGTGFLIMLEDPRFPKNRAIVWIATCDHVLRRIRPDGTPGPYLEEVTVRYNTKKPVTEDGRQFQQSKARVLDEHGELIWYTHPSDQTADVALFPFSLLEPRPDSDTIDTVWIPLSMFATNERLAALKVTENDEVFFSGFFPWYSGIKKNYPIVRHGKICLLPQERIPLDLRRPNLAADIFLVEVTSFGGNSGSPVFLRISGIREGSDEPPSLGWKYYVLGVMKGFFPEASKVVVQTELLEGVMSQNSGIAIVVPAQKIVDILESPKVKGRVNNLVDGPPKPKLEGPH